MTLATVTSLHHIYALFYKIEAWQRLCFPITIWKLRRKRKTLAIDSDSDRSDVRACNQLLSELEFGPGGQRIIRTLHIRRAVFMQGISHWALRQAFGSHALKVVGSDFEIRMQPNWLRRVALVTEMIFGLLLGLGYFILVLDSSGTRSITTGTVVVAAGMLASTWGWFVSHRLGRQWKLGVEVLTKICTNDSPCAIRRR